MMLAAKNRYTYLRRELSARLLRMYVRDEILDCIDGLPVSMVPREKESLRCCIYRDRAMLRSRILTLLGVDLERDDEVKSLSFYAAEVLLKRRSWRRRRSWKERRRAGNSSPHPAVRLTRRLWKNISPSCSSTSPGRLLPWNT